MIYIDSLKSCKPTKEWKWTSYCHLFADSLDELHDFAKKLGMRREWAQFTKLPHYDLTAKRRVKALELGAKEVSMSWVKDKLKKEKEVRASYEKQETNPKRPC